MITIKIPENNIHERKYILDTIFNDYLGLEYQLSFSEKTEDWELHLSNQNRLTFRDSFFNKFPNDMQYMQASNIPQKIELARNEFIKETNLPVLYGKPEISSSLNTESKAIRCEIDIFASAFFMLTRWEEHVSQTRDSHDRFPASASLAYKNNFIFRPVVDEYVFMLKQMLACLDNSIAFKNTEGSMFVSCDVDAPFDCTVQNVRSLLKACGGDIIKRKTPLEALKRTRRFIFNKFGNFTYDNSYTFKWYMDQCEKSGLKAAFYFIPDNTEKGNGCYALFQKDIQVLLRYIADRGHEIGVHGSYNTYRNPEKILREKNMLEDALSSAGVTQAITGNRQHYLRWDSSVTPSALDKSGYEYDTTGSYADCPGFRYGTCSEFRLYDFINRETLSIRERPLIVMEGSVLSKAYLGLSSAEQALELMIKLKRTCFRYNGIFSLLWHNNHFDTEEEKEIFKAVLSAD